MNKRFVFDKTNMYLLILGIVMLIIGYFLMAQGDITISPILLIIAYLIIFPLSIIWGAFIGKKKPNNTQDKENRNEKYKQTTKAK